jgi:aspartate/methionine/tyrosine aminotransferase
MGLKIGKGASAPPFLVMDVITAANARQAALPAGAPHVIRMEVGQPGTGAPAGAVAAAQAALRSGHPLGYTEAFGRCVTGSPPMRGTGMGWICLSIESR